MFHQVSLMFYQLIQIVYILILVITFLSEYYYIACVIGIIFGFLLALIGYKFIVQLSFFYGLFFGLLSGTILFSCIPLKFSYYYIY